MVRAVWALAVLYLFPVFLLGVIGTLGWVVFAVVPDGWAALAAQITVVPLLVAVVWSAIELIRAPRPALEGVELTRDDHPRLWAEVDRLAAGMSTSSPNRIMLLAEPNARILEYRGRRELGIGLPFLVADTVPELRATIAHELGHVSGGHTALTARARVGGDFLTRVADNAAPFTRWLVVPYAALATLTAAWASRHDEAQADALATAVSDPRDAAQSLRTELAAMLAWAALTEHAEDLFDLANARAGMADGLRELMTRDAQSLTEAVDEALVDEQASAFDTHPLSRDRIARYTQLTRTEQPPAVSWAARQGESDEADAGASAGLALADGDLPGHQPRAVCLLEGGWDWLRDHEAELFDLREPMTDWDQVAAVGGNRGVVRAARELVLALDLARLMPSATYRGLLEAFESQRWDDLADALDPGDGSGEARARAGVVTVVSAALVESGLAGHRLSWTDGLVVLEGPTGDRLNLDELLDVGERSPAVALAYLVDAGADLDARPGARTPDARPEVLAAITAATGPWAGARDLLVCSTGLAGVPTGRSGLHRYLADHGERRVALAAQRADSLPSDPEVHWVPLSDIAAARVIGILGDALDVRLLDGSLLTFRPTMDSEPVEEPGTAIRFLLGDRARAAAWDDQPPVELARRAKLRLLWRDPFTKVGAFAAVVAGLGGAFLSFDAAAAGVLESREGMQATTVEIVAEPDSEGGVEVRFAELALSDDVLDGEETLIVDTDAFAEPDTLAAGQTRTVWVRADDPETYLIEDGGQNRAAGDRNVDLAMLGAGVLVAVGSLVFAGRRTRASYRPAR
ncbi:MAG: M48 family metalloprotease [Actinomycetales bacterium]